MKKKFILIIIIILLIIAEVFVLLSLTAKKENKNEETITLDINSELVQKLYKMANPSDNAVLLDDLYGNDKLTDKYKIAMGIADYLKNNEPIPVENPEYVFYYIPENDVDEHIKFVLGDNVKYKPQDVFIMKDDICGLNYNKELKRYEDSGGCGDMGMENYYRKIDSAFTKDNKIYIKEKSFYVYNDWDDYISKVSVFSNYDKKDMLDYFEQDSSEALTIDEDKYINKGSVYQYEFEKRDNNNNYIFKGIKRIK